MTADKHQRGSSTKPRGIVRRIRRAVILYCLVPYLTVTVIFAVFQRRLMYHPTRAEDLSLVGDLKANFGVDVQLTTSTGQTIHGWLVHGTDRNHAELSREENTRQEKRPPQLVLYFPGNSLNRHERIDDLREVASCGFDVLIFDYCGFGDSTGTPSETELTADARLVWQYATDELGYDETETVIFGESLGGAVALSLWEQDNPQPPRPAALILNSTFASMPRTVASHYPLFPFHYLLLDRWPSIDRIGNVHAPVVIFHGDQDQIVPISHSKALAAASVSAKFIQIHDGSHNDIPMLRLRDELDALKTPHRKTRDNALGE